MTPRNPLAVTFVLATVLGACQTVPEDFDRPARIINPDAASRAALQETVDMALGTHVTLSDSALTDSSLLTIEVSPKPTMENPMPQGRNMDPAIQFRLVRNGDECVLVNTRDRSRYALANTSCEVE